MMDLIVSVSAPEQLRIQRVIKRSNMSREEVLARIRNQVDQDEINRRADVIIHNDDEHLVLPQIMQLHEKILQKRLFL
jgi:dephospho-CoA kinase